MAAGEGRRLRPLTERWPKPLLPIGGRPVIATLLRELASAGFERVTVVVGHLGRQIEALLGDGSAFGLRVRFAQQPEAIGSADAVARALAAGARAPVLVAVGDIVYRRGAIRETTERWLASGAAGGLGVRAVPPAELPERSSVRTVEGRVLEMVEKPQADAAIGPLAGAGLWFLDEELCGSLATLPGPPFELAAALQSAIDAGRTIAALEVGPTRDLTRPEDVILRNFPYLSR